MVKPSDCRSLNVTSSTVYRPLLLLLLLLISTPSAAASLTPAVNATTGVCVDGSKRIEDSSGVRTDVVTLSLLLLR